MVGATGVSRPDTRKIVEKRVGRVLHERAGQPLVALAVVDGGAAYSTPPAIHANRN